MYSLVCIEHQRIVSELYLYKQSLRTVDSEELEAVADKMRGKEDHIRIVEKQMNALSTNPFNLPQFLNTNIMYKYQ